MNLAATDPGLLAAPFAAGLVVLATHVPLGITVLRRGIIFIDLAVAQVAALGVILAAVYLFFMFQKLFLGPVTLEENQKLKDVSAREIIILAPILLVAFWIGIYPKPFFLLMAPAVEKLAVLVQSAALLAH